MRVDTNIGKQQEELTDTFRETAERFYPPGHITLGHFSTIVVILPRITVPETDLFNLTQTNYNSLEMAANLKQGF